MRLLHCLFTFVIISYSVVQSSTFRSGTLRKSARLRERSSRIINKYNGGNFEIHSPKGMMPLAQPLKFCCRTQVEIQDYNRAIVIQMSFQSPVRFNLLHLVVRARERYASQPRICSSKVIIVVARFFR